MSDPPAGLEVVCPACGGRSAVEPANRSHSHWGCPFCGASNPLAEAPSAVASLPPRMGRRGTRAAAVIVVTGLTVAAVVAQTSLPRGEYRTVEGLTAALADRGVPCRSPAPASPPEGAREAATCVIAASAVRILTFASPARRDRYLAAGPAGTMVAGATWLIIPDDRRLVPRIAGAMGGRVIRPGEGSPNPSKE